ncbi:MAG: putative RNA-binding Zn-ribbon protein involved in translation (DUF1610 family) [Haloarculaceae archaeon]|jgi:predicted RNA-binding Zn-ribbon protein involved in translation (DUF1610 family)
MVSPGMGWPDMTYRHKTIMINNGWGVGGSGMTQCTRCGTRMRYNDETTKLTEYACPQCHNTEIIQKESFRVTA